jgi:hypothetical protein
MWKFIQYVNLNKYRQLRKKNESDSKIFTFEDEQTVLRAFHFFREGNAKNFKINCQLESDEKDHKNHLSASYDLNFFLGV